MSPTTRARLSVLADALQDLLHSQSQRSIARSLGLSPETPAQRGARPTAWPIDDLLTLGEEHPPIADALRALFAAAESAVPTCTAEKAVKGVIAGAAGSIQRAIDRLQDDQLQDDELRDTDSEFASLQAQISQARAVIRRRRRQLP